MPMMHLPEIGAKASSRKPVPVSNAFDVQFGTEFLSASLYVSKRGAY